MNVRVDQSTGATTAYNIFAEGWLQDPHAPSFNFTNWGAWGAVALPCLLFPFFVCMSKDLPSSSLGSSRAITVYGRVHVHTCECEDACACGCNRMCICVICAPAC